MMPQGYLLQNIVLFSRLLRGVGIQVTPTQIVDLVSALNHIDLTQRQDVKNTAQAILISQADQFILFNQAFDLFWQAHRNKQFGNRGWERPNIKPPIRNHEQLLKTLLSMADESSGLEEAEAPFLETIYTYSPLDIIRHKDFAKLEPEELAEVERLIKMMRWQLGMRQTRRKIKASHGQFLDIRRMLRHNLRHGGELLQLTWQRRQQKRRPLVLLCDISGSMERYSRVLLKFIYAISNQLDRVEAFIFGTRLTRVTHQLQQRDVDTALNEATQLVQDWGGGTRIGESLKTFNYVWGRRVLGQGAIVIIISDGWDRGDVDLFEREMKRLQLSCQRLIWLNPHLGSANYEPLTRGIQRALPHIDHFMPVHNLVSLEQLGQLLGRLDTQPR